MFYDILRLVYEGFATLFTAKAVKLRKESAFGGSPYMAPIIKQASKAEKAHRVGGSCSMLNHMVDMPVVLLDGGGWGREGRTGSIFCIQSAAGSGAPDCCKM